MAVPKLALPNFANDSWPRPAESALRVLDEGRTVDGLHLLLEANRQYPSHAGIENYVGAAYYRLNRFDEALEHFGRASRLAPEVSAYSCNEGSACLMLGRHIDAFRAYLRSLNSDEMLHEAHRWAWSALGGCGKLSDAVNRLKQALRHDPTDITNEATQIELPSVTICVVDCIDPILALRSLSRSLQLCRFAAAKLFTSDTLQHDSIEIVRIDELTSKDGYSNFIVKKLGHFIETETCLVTQWDAHVADAHAWSDEFLEYDYIGATWDPDLVRKWNTPISHNVGNGGFSLRSKRFLGAGLDTAISRVHPEDAQLCRMYRPLLEERYRIRFASAAVADRFAFEANLPERLPFGFHGIYNLCCIEGRPDRLRFEFLQ